MKMGRDTPQLFLFLTPVWPQLWWRRGGRWIQRVDILRRSSLRDDAAPNSNYPSSWESLKVVIVVRSLVTQTYRLPQHKKLCHHVKLQILPPKCRGQQQHEKICNWRGMWRPDRAGGRGRGRLPGFCPAGAR